MKSLTLSTLLLLSLSLMSSAGLAPKNARGLIGGAAEHAARDLVVESVASLVQTMGPVVTRTSVASVGIHTGNFRWRWGGVYGGG